jgi:protein LTV1
MDEASDVASVASSAMVPQNEPIREDFDALMDDFLGSYSMAGKRRVKKGKHQTGVEQLDELVSLLRFDYGYPMTSSLFGT